MSAAPTQQPHSVYQQLVDISSEIERAREELYDVCEKSHLVMDDQNPTFQKDNQIAGESYKYAKENIQTPYYKEIHRALAGFQKKVNNARIKVENMTRNLSQHSHECCSTCSRNIQIKKILIQLYFQKDQEISSNIINQFSPVLSSVSESLSSSISSISSA